MTVKRLMTQAEFSKELEKHDAEFCIMSEGKEKLIGKKILYHEKYADFTVPRNLRIRYKGGKWQKPYIVQNHAERFVKN